MLDMIFPGERWAVPWSRRLASIHASDSAAEALPRRCANHNLSPRAQDGPRARIRAGVDVQALVERLYQSPPEVIARAQAIVTSNS